MVQAGWTVCLVRRSALTVQPGSSRRRQLEPISGLMERNHARLAFGLMWRMGTLVLSRVFTAMEKEIVLPEKIGTGESEILRMVATPSFSHSTGAGIREGIILVTYAIVGPIGLTFSMVPR